jgi:hypothetical protein
MSEYGNTAGVVGSRDLGDRSVGSVGPGLDRITVLVCGGRRYNDNQKLVNALFGLHLQRPIGILVHGDAGEVDVTGRVLCGADKLAGRWARLFGVKVKAYPADWDTHGRSAGPIRNSQMLAQERPDVVVALPGGSGTADLVTKARKAGIEVIEVV